MTLPGGRGRRAGPDARSDTHEWFAERGSAPPPGLWYSSAVGGNIVGGSPLSTSARVGVIAPVLQPLRVKYAQLRCAAAGASNTVKCALYRWLPNGTSNAQIVPGSEATFTAAAVSTVRYTFPQEFDLVPGETYFMMAVSTAGAATFCAWQIIDFARTISPGTVLATDYFPGRLYLDADTNPAGGTAMPSVVYFSLQGNRIV